MHPVLFRISDLVFPSYFVFVASAFVLAVFIGVRRSALMGERPVDYVDMAMAIAIGGFIGARLFHVLMATPEFYWQRPLQLLQFWNGGFALYGGLIGGTFAAWILTQRRRLSPWHAADIAAPGVALGIALGRLGCFCAGCCFGRPSDHGFPWTIVFSEVDGLRPQAQPLGEPLLATQIWSSFSALGLYFILLALRGRMRRQGELSLLFLIGYSVMRFLIEMARNDQQRGLYFEGLISSSQLVAVLVAIASLTTFVIRRKKVYASVSV